MVKSEPSLVQQFEHVMSPSGANEEIRDLTAEESKSYDSYERKAEPKSPTLQAPAGYQTIFLPDELAVSIFGQMSYKQMEATWI